MDSKVTYFWIFLEVLSSVGIAYSHIDVYDVGASRSIAGRVAASSYSTAPQNNPKIILRLQVQSLRIDDCSGL